MGTMTLVRPPAVLPTDVIVRGGPVTRAERDALPPDGWRHELLDGMLVMSPAPSWRHQDIVASVLVLFRTTVPRELKAMTAPFDVTLGPATVIEPDIVICRRTDTAPDGLHAAPVLAIEVLCPSTKLFDLGRKKDLLEAAGCPSYWVVDPVGPTLTAYELQDGRYAEVARVSDDESWTATAPYPVTIVPRDLLDD